MNAPRRPAWEIKQVTFTGEACYPFHVSGTNHYELERGLRGWLSWRVPADIWDKTYDIEGATFHGVTALLERAEGSL